MQGKNCSPHPSPKARGLAARSLVKEPESSFTDPFYSPLLPMDTIKSHQTRCGGISQRKKHLLEQDAFLLRLYLCREYIHKACTRQIAFGYLAFVSIITLK